MHWQLPQQHPQGRGCTPQRRQAVFRKNLTRSPESVGSFWGRSWKRKGTSMIGSTATRMTTNGSARSQTTITMGQKVEQIRGLHGGLRSELTVVVMPEERAAGATRRAEPLRAGP